MDTRSCGVGIAWGTNRRPFIMCIVYTFLRMKQITLFMDVVYIVQKQSMSMRTHKLASLSYTRGSSIDV